MKKSDIKKIVSHARKELKKLKNAMLVFNIHANSIYIFDVFGDDVIEVCKTEEEAIDCINGIYEESGYNTGCYYRPMIIDSDSGEQITRKNLKHYLK
jgi:hypothetical protein